MSPAVDALLREARQAAARRTIADRQRHEGLVAARDAIARLQAAS